MSGIRLLFGGYDRAGFFAFVGFARIKRRQIFHALFCAGIACGHKTPALADNIHHPVFGDNGSAFGQKNTGRFVILSV